jgi:transposase InsO family protein
VGFLERALGWFAGQGVTVERVMTDNGSAYRSHAFCGAVAAAGVKHKRTRARAGNGDHESPRTTKLCDRTKERLTQDEVERIGAA